MVHIAVLMMVKNEKKRLKITLESIKNFADSLVIFDTGSTDNTIDICKEFCETNKIPLRLKEGVFENFSISRNVSLEFADSFEEIDYLLLLDTNDELRGGKFLRQCAEEYVKNPSTGFLTCQEWWSGQHDKYFNVRFIKAHQQWRYRGSVHEYIKTLNEENDKHPIVKLPDSIVIYQDRTQDDDKSGKRFNRDKELLHAEYKLDPTEPRTVFYLAQTCACLNQHQEAFFYYKMRTTLEGFQEEKFHSFLRAGELSQKLGHDWHDSFIWYMKAFEHSHRAEPLLFISIYYINMKMWILAYTYLKLACNLSYPHEAILFVNKNDYEYKRWHLMGIVAYYVGQVSDGKIACLIAIEYSKKNNSMVNTDLDEKNLKFYLEKEKEEQQKTNTKVSKVQIDRTKEIFSKKQFMEDQTQIIMKESPNLNPKQLNIRLNMLWTNHCRKNA